MNTVVRLKGHGAPREPGAEPETPEQYVHDRVADLLLLAAAVYGLDSAEAGNMIVMSVIQALEDAEVHVPKDTEPLRTLMEISEEAERAVMSIADKSDG